MLIKHFRFYSGDNTGGGGKPQDGNGNPQDGNRETTNPADTVQDTGTEDEATAAKIKRANDDAAKARVRQRELEAQLKELQEEREQANASTQTESQRIQAQVAKLTEQLKVEKAARVEAERLRMAQSAASRHDLPEEFLPALVGETQDEIDEAAKLLQKVFLAQAKKLAQVTPPNPEGGSKAGVTAAANGKVSAEEQKKNDREYAQAF